MYRSKCFRCPLHPSLCPLASSGSVPLSFTGDLCQEFKSSASDGHRRAVSQLLSGIPISHHAVELGDCTEVGPRSVKPSCASVHLKAAKKHPATDHSEGT